MSEMTVGAALDCVLRASTARRSITADHGTEFQSLALEDWAYQRDAQSKIEAWRIDYNQRPPHRLLGHLTPNEF